MHELLSNTVLWGLLLGLLTPVLTAVVQQPHWAKNTRLIVGVVVSGVVGVLTCLSTGELGNGSVTVATLTAIVASSKLAYDKLWQRSGVTDAVEEATSPGY